MRTNSLPVLFVDVAHHIPHLLAHFLSHNCRIFFEHVIINMTAFGGAYMLIRGISFYAGGFPNEFTLADQLKAGDTSAFTNWFYLYMVCILIVAVVCSVVQYKTNNREEKTPY